MSDMPWPPVLHWPDEPLTDGVVLLDRLTAADVPRIVAACNDPDSRRWLPLPSPYGEAEASAYIESRTGAAQSGQELTFAVRDAGDGLLAGAIGIIQRGHRHEADIGYWTSPDRRGRGWTAAAVRLLVRWALTTMPLRRIEIIADAGNHRSRHVAVTAGALYEGIRRSGLPSGGTEDAAIYAFVPADLTDPRLLGSSSRV